jgi:hypothetical protein
MRSKIMWGSVVAALACAVWFFPRTADALSCASNWIRAPENGAVGVPTNTLLWSYGRFGGTSRARLIGPAGEVPTEERFLPVAIDGYGQGTNFPVLAPLLELEPNTRYSIEVSSGDGSIERNWFQTGGGPSVVAPPLPVLVSSEPGFGQGWSGLNRWNALEFAHAGILMGDNGALGDVTSADDVLLDEDAGFVAIEVEASTPVVRWLTTLPELYVGVGDCLIWPEGAEDRQDARFGVLDLAGNFSGWLAEELLLPSAQQARGTLDAELAREQALAAADLESRREADVRRREALNPVSCALERPGASAGGKAAMIWLALGAALATRRRGARS